MAKYFLGNSEIYPTPLIPVCRFGRGMMTPDSCCLHSCFFPLRDENDAILLREGSLFNAEYFSFHILFAWSVLWESLCGGEWNEISVWLMTTLDFKMESFMTLSLYAISDHLNVYISRAISNEQLTRGKTIPKWLILKLRRFPYLLF